MRKTSFVLEPLGGYTFAGFTEGDDWNGWAAPLFTKEQAQQIVSAWQQHGWQAHYSEEKDAFVFSVSQDIETNDSTEAEEFIAVERDGKKFYSVGAYSWIWEEAEGVLTMLDTD